MSAAANDVFRGGYRTSARAPTTPRVEPALGDGARELALVRQRLYAGLFPIALVVSLVLVAAVAAALREGSLALVAGASIGWALLVVACGATLRSTHADRVELRRGWVCAAADGRGSFVDEGGARWRLHLPCATGPASARVLPATRDVLAVASIERGADEEREAVQRVLDAHFGVSAHDRNVLARGEVPAGLRRRFWRLRPFRAPEVAAVSLEVVGPVRQFVVRGHWLDEPYQSVFAVGHVTAPCAPPPPLQQDDVARVFYAFRTRCERRATLLAIELVERAGPTLREPLDVRGATNLTIDAFRARLH